MFTKIGVENFKLFKNPVEFELKPITVLTGPNSSGKSTFNKLLYLIANGFKTENQQIFVKDFGKKNIENINFSNNVIKEIGSFKDCLTRNSKEKSIKLKYTFSDQTDIEVATKLSYGGIGNKIAGLGSFALCYKGMPFFEIELVNEDELFKSENLDSFHFNKNIFNPYGWRLDPNKIENYAKTFRNYLLDVRNKEEFLNKDKKLESYYSVIENSFLRGKNGMPLLDENGEFKKEKYLKNDGYDLICFMAKNNKEYLLIQSLFCERVLNAPHFFDSEIRADNEIEKLRKLLALKGISTKKQFIDYYKKFEEQLIKVMLLNWTSKLNRLVSTDFDGQFYGYEKKEISELFSLKDFKDDNLTVKRIMNLIGSIDNPLTQFFLDELSSDDNENDLIFDGNNIEVLFNIKNNEADKKITNRNVNNLYHVFWIKIANLYRGIKSELDKTITSNERVVIYKQDITVRPYYMIDDVSLENDLVKSFGQSWEFNKERDKIVFFNKWLKRLMIGEELILETIKRNSEVMGYSFFVNDKEGAKININSLGLGAKKIILLLMQIVMQGGEYKEYSISESEFEDIKKLDRERIVNSRKLLLIEEPESNLHPSFQSKLAEIFVDALYNLNVRFIIETHSEYLIRKMQHLIASEESLFGIEDVSIHYLHDPNTVPEGESQVYKLDIREDGFMNNDFGKGFLDESSSLTLSLLNLPNFN